VPLTMPDLLQGVTPTFDAQAIPDSTDWSILAAADAGNGVAAASAPVVSPCTTTVTNTNTVTLASLNGTGTLTISSAAALPPGGGYLTVPTTGGGTATISYTAGSGSTLSNPFYITGSGGSGSIASGATMTSICAVQITGGYAAAGNVPVHLNSGSTSYVSIVNPSGTIWQSLPASATDRKDTLVCTTAGVLSILQGTACAQAGWTRNNGSYTNAPPVKAAWASGTPIVLTEIYVQATGQSGANTIAAGNLVDKSVPIVAPNLNPNAAGIDGSADITLSNSAWTTVCTITIPATGTSLPTWMMIGGVTVEETAGATTSEVEMQIVAGTAAFFGPLGGLTSGETTLTTTGSTDSLPFAASGLVSTPGTILVQARASGSATVKAKKTTVTTGVGQATGYVVLRAS
jgi:hypothetical protein